NPSTPVLLNDLQWLTAYLTIHSLSDASRVYSYILWIAIGIVLAIFSLVHHLGLRGGYIGAYWTKWAVRRRTWRKKHSLAVAAKLGQPHRQPKSLPSNGQILALTALVIGTLALCYIGPDYLAPGSYIWNVGSTPTASIAKRASYDPALFIPFQAKYTIPKAWWTTAARTGQIAFALLPLCILFALKMPPFAIFANKCLTDLHFDKLAFLHRWCGFLIWFITTLHIASWSVQLADETRKGKVLYQYAFQYQKFIFGWSAYGLLTLIMIFSIPPLRTRHYEAFYFLHILLVPLMIVLCALHHPPVWQWCWAALAVWGAERLYRFGWWLFINGFFGGLGRSSSPVTSTSPPQASIRVVPDAVSGQPIGIPSLHDKSTASAVSHRYPPVSTAKPVLYSDGYVPPRGYFHAEVLPGRTVRLRIVTPRHRSWAPGQHFLIHIPAVCRFTTHPFTTASVCDQTAASDAGYELEFFIRAKKGWTKDLWDTVALMTAQGRKLTPGEKIPDRELPPHGVLLRGFVDGPFGSSRRAVWGDYSTAVIVAGGSGVSFALSILQYLCLCMAGRDGHELGGRSGGFGKPGFKMTRVRFVWLVREFGHIQWCATALRKCMTLLPSSELRIDIFVTNVKYPVPPPRQLTQRLEKVVADELEPPVPSFVKDRSDERKSRSPSISSMESDSSDSLVDLSYYESDLVDEEQGELGHEEHALDLTNFDDDDDTALPGEAQLNLTIKKEAQIRRSFIKRASVALAAKQELDKRTSALYEQHSAAPSAVRLLDPQRPSSAAPPQLELITEHIRVAGLSRMSQDIDHLRSPLSATDIQTPTSAAALLEGHRQSFGSPMSPPGPSRLSNPPSGETTSRPVSSRPGSVLSSMSAWSDAHSLAALVSEAAAQEQIRVELNDAELADIGIVAEHAHAGKPKLDRILAEEVERSKGAVIVGCCGPTSLNALIRKSVAAQINPARICRGDMRGSISLVAEDFGY
ncbi:hypothetical protein K474DRAFT_1574151, partial [Panus rudis PR-1116 ss-1]